MTRLRATTDDSPWAEGAALVEPIAKILAAIDWDFADADTRHNRHGIHPYPAKFPPQLPETLIRLFTRPGELVVDCFGGSGTTAVEALRAGRRAASIDANPIAALVTRVKTMQMDEKVRGQLDSLLARIETAPLIEGPIAQIGRDRWRPRIPNIDRWYASHIVDELAGLRAIIDETVSGGPARDIAMLALATAAARLSFQDSETRYKSVPRTIEPGEASERLLTELCRLVEDLEQRPLPEGDLVLVEGDARAQSSYPFERGSVDLVVTSPPYPNAYDYHLYHRFRIYWLGGDPGDLRRVEIGSHLMNQAAGDAVGRYERDMLATLRNVAEVLRPGRYAVFVVGDGIHNGQSYPTANALSSLSRLIGFEPVGEVQRRLPTQRRSVTVAGRRLAKESILVLRKPDPQAGPQLQPPGYELFPYEADLAIREFEVLRRRSTEAPLRSVRQAAFSYAVAGPYGYEPTLQAASEHDPVRPGKKNSTYAAHGLHRYKGKFYPQLAKALLNLTDPYGRPGVVCDPFGGSGTVATEARLAGLTAVSIDQNPLAAAVAQAKVAFLDVPVQQLATTTEQVTRARELHASEIDWEQFVPSVRAEVGSWFAPRILAKVSQLLSAIRGVTETDARYGQALRGIFEAVVSDLVREVSDQEPSDLRIRRRFEPLEDAPVADLFATRALRLVERRRLIQFRLESGPALGAASIVQGDAATPEVYDPTPISAVGISCVVSSPPYGIALPYLDTDRLSLAAVYGVDRSARRDLEAQLIGSREISNGERARWEGLSDALAADLPMSTTDFLERLRKAVDADPSAGFRRQQTPAVLARYFVSMSRVLQQLARRLNDGAELTLVLGDSRTTLGGSTWVVPTVDEVAAIARHRGLALVEEIPITVTREGLLHSRNSIVQNRVLRLRAD